MLRKSIYLSIVIIVFVGILPAVAAVSTKENIKESKDGNTYDFDVSPGQTIYLDLKSGAGVTIRGWDKSRAEVSYVQRGRGPSHDVGIYQERDGLRIESTIEPHDGSARDLDFEIRLPNKYNVHFESTGGGLKIIDLTGKFTGTTMGGGYTLKEVDGTVSLTTMGGAIEVTGSDLDGKISTMGGTVYLKDVVGDLEAESMGGNVRYENVRGRDGELRAPEGSMDEMGVKTVTITTMGGDIEVDEAPAGAWVRTMGGDIEVEDASYFVKATTMGGNINIRVSDGWVDASTMAGDVDVTVLEGLGDDKKGVNLSSCCGDVTLMLPAGLPVDLDLTISYTKNSSQDFRFITDYDLDIERSTKWDYSNGSPRKRIHGTATVGSGKYPIVIKTINGDIRLKTIE